MKALSHFLGAALLALVVVGQGLAQDDETRQQTGLPTLITKRGGENVRPGSDATVTGVVIVQALADGAVVPPLTVVLMTNGAVIERRRIQNRGAFNFTNVPRMGISLTLEAEGQEVVRYQLGNINPTPLDNRQDIVVTGAQIGEAVKQRNEVISVLNSYQRTSENQKQFEKALEGSKEKKSESALKLFKQVVDSDPNDFVAWNEVGNLYFASQNYKDAATAYQKCLDLKSDFRDALLNLGKLYLIQKQSDASIDTLSTALILMPDSADVNHFLGEAYLQAKKGSKAVIYLNKAIELAPIQNAEIHLRLAALYNGANLKDHASEEYKKFLLKVPNYPDRATLEKYIKDNSPK